MKKTLLILLAFLVFRNCFSQSASDPAKFPKMTPPPPDAAALGRYGEFPVTLATGTPDVSIPLYEIKTGKLSLPISLNYHASGIRVNDIASRAGLGWSLIAGGNISRVVKGLPDEQQPQGYFAMGIPTDNASAESIECFINALILGLNQKDGEPDDFYYAFKGKNGRFIFTNRQATGTDPVPVTIPYDLIKISFNINQIRITDVDGTLYVFGTSLLGRIAIEKSTTQTGGGNFQYGVTNIPTNWYLTDIVSADKQDTIKLIYSTPAVIFHETHVSTTLTDDVTGPYPDSYTTGIGISQTYSYEAHLTDIFFRNGKVSFDYSNPRLDVAGDSGLAGIRVYQFANNAYSQIKKYIFYQSNFTCRNISPQPALYANDPGDPSKRLRLDSVKQVDINGNVLPGYVFGYVPKQLPYLGSYAQDFWGFYNAAPSNTSLLIYNTNASQSVPPSPTYGANRSVNPDSVDAGMLNKITFPTGGSTRFTFEPNQYFSNNVGGLRIKKIVSLDNNGGGMTKIYNYYAPVPISNLYNSDLSAMALFFLIPYRDLEKQAVGNPIKKSYNTYYENFSFPLGSSSGAAVSYGRVQELYDSTGGNNGKTEYTYTTYQDESPTVAPQNTVTSEWRRGEVLTKKVYKSVSTGNYTLLSSQQNIYAYNSRPSFALGSIAARASYIDQNGLSGVSGYPSCSQWSTTNVIYSSYNQISVGNDYLIQQIDTTFDQNGSNPLIDTTNFFYDDTSNIHPVRTEKKDSKGRLVKLISRTPLEKTDMNASLTLALDASVAIDSLLAVNNIAPVLDQEKYVDGNLVSRIRTNYKVFSSKLTERSAIQEQTFSNPVETRVQFTNYDTYGNIISGGKPGDAPTTYIWDYLSTEPIALANNADSNSIAYSSFEADGSGNWIIHLGSRAAVGITGDSCYVFVSGASISKTGLNSGVAYTVSYWTQNATPFSITGTASGYPVKGRTVNGWTYYEHRISGQTGVTITGTGSIDELRLYPSNATMTTYTYKRLVGPSSVCDINNRITYYQYDPFLRLWYIKDQDGYIIKTLEYHYQGQ